MTSKYAALRLFQSACDTGRSQQVDIGRHDRLRSETIRKHSDHDVRSVVEINGFADDRWIAAQTLLPESECNNHAARAVDRTGLTSPEQLSHHRTDSDHVEEVVANDVCADGCR